MSWGLDLLKAVAKAIVPEAAKRLLDRALPTKRQRAPGEFSSRDVAIQNRASHVPEAHKVCSVCSRAGGHWAGCMHATGGEDTPSSPRAITQRYAIPPPPPSARRKR